jgi:hypothetical protein
MKQNYLDQTQVIPAQKSKAENIEWKTVGVKIRINELAVLNRQLARLNYNTLGDLVKELIAGKITHVTEDQQINIMKANLQASGPGLRSIYCYCSVFLACLWLFVHLRIIHCHIF